MVATMDNRGRSRLFGCFNSPTKEEDEQSSDPVAPPPSPPLPSPPPPPPPSCDENLRWRRTALRNLSGSLKSVFFKAPLVKKLKSKRPLRRDYYRSISSLSSKLKRPVKKLTPARKGYPEMEDIIESDDSDHYSLFSSTSASTCASSVSSLESENVKISDSSLDLPLVVAGTSYSRHNAIKRADGGMKFKYSAAATGMCMFLVCLVALVFWGKAIAIVTCTSAWLFLAANYRRSMGGEAAAAVKEVVAVNNAVLDSEEDKKRVIMEGLLDRSRPRFIQP